MKIILAGGTGFLGRPLAHALLADGHDVVVLTRDTVRNTVAGAHVVAWTPDGQTGSWAAEIDGADAIVNLAGEPIAARRWSHEYKRRIQESRIRATRSLVEAIGSVSSPPVVFVSASAVGYYGSLGDEIIGEDTPPGSDFLARVCMQWEVEAERASSARTRVACLRTGLVLAKDGGALPRMLPPFKLGLGGPVGSGRQYWPWIHRQDWIELVRWIIGTPSASGPINASAPNPTTSREFARALGRALHRPAFAPAPAFALRLLLGEMADALLLAGQRAVPAKATRLGFRFAYSQLDDALGAIFGS